MLAVTRVCTGWEGRRRGGGVRSSGSIPLHVVLGAELSQPWVRALDPVLGTPSCPRDVPLPQHPALGTPSCPTVFLGDPPSTPARAEHPLASAEAGSDPPGQCDIWSRGQDLGSVPSIPQPGPASLAPSRLIWTSRGSTGPDGGFCGDWNLITRLPPENLVHCLEDPSGVSPPVPG